MTQELFRAVSCLTGCSATVTAIGAQGIALGRTVFYPMGGGQAGDAGMLVVTAGARAGREIALAGTREGKDAQGRTTRDICHLPAAPFDDPGAPPLAVGGTVIARIDWQRRHRLMRFHTTTHRLCQAASGRS